jgi:hypothetical protein
MATYKLVYGDADDTVNETLDNITSIEHEDGWTVFFRGDDAILRVQDAHVLSMELVTK